MKGEEIKIAAVNNFKSLQKRVPHGQVVRILTFTAMVQVQSLVGELRSCKPCGMAKKKKFARKRERNRVTVKE